MCFQRYFTVNVMRSIDNHSLRSQPLPVKPGWQPHSPVTWLQEVARGQWHRWAHRFPYEPGKQTERAQMSYGGSVSRGQLTDIGGNYFSRSVSLSSLPDTCRCQWCDDMGRYDHTCNAPYSLAHINLEYMLIRTHRMGLMYMSSSLWSFFYVYNIMIRSPYDVFYPSHSVCPPSLLDRNTCHSVGHTRHHSHTRICVDTSCQNVPEHILKNINRTFGGEKKTLSP